MSNFYTYAKAYGNNILFKGYVNGEQMVKKMPFSPTLYIPSNKPSEWHSLYDNKPLEPIKFDTIKEAKDFKEKYKDVAGFKVHGIDRWEYQFINENFEGDIDYNIALARILVFDIEVISDSGFPDIQSAAHPIVNISLNNSKTGITTVLGLKDYNRSPDDKFEYKQFNSEKELLLYFIAYNQIHKFDIWTGWNTSEFDIPYVVNRIMRLFDESMVKKLSPFGIIREKVMEIRGRMVQTYDIFGIVDLDFMQLFKKFTYERKERYTLDFIAFDVLGENKLELPGESFKDSYDNHYDIFVRYNAVDTFLVRRLEDNLKLIELAFSLAFLYKCNLQDIFKTVLPWEIFIFNHLSKKKIAVPPKRLTLDAEFEGAWVKEAKPKMYGWMMSFDFASLYPSIIRQWNISPETFVPAEHDVKVFDFVYNTIHAQDAQKTAKNKNYALCANGTMYKKEFQGFLAELMQYVMDGRKIAKKEMLKLEKEYQQTKDESLLPRIAALNNRQMAFKISANSAYGAIGNKGFLYYEYRMAEAITLTGQLSDQDLANRMNIMMNGALKTRDVDYILMADTDSIYLNCEKLVDIMTIAGKLDSIESKVSFLDEFGEKVCQKIINESVDDIFERTNAFNKVMASKREAIASKGLIRGKKNYALYIHNSEGVTYNPPKLKPMGIEIVRSSTPKWARKSLKECLQMMFEKDEQTLKNHFEKLEAEFKKLPVEDIAFPRGVSDIDKWSADGRGYKGRCPIHVRASLLYNMHTSKFQKYAPIQNGDKIKFVYLKMPNSIGENIIGFPAGGTLPKELGLDKYVDYEKQFDATFKEPLQSLTDVAEFALVDITTLEDFFV